MAPGAVHFSRIFASTISLGGLRLPRNPALRAQLHSNPAAPSPSQPLLTCSLLLLSCVWQEPCMWGPASQPKPTSHGQLAPRCTQNCVTGYSRTPLRIKQFQKCSQVHYTEDLALDEKAYQDESSTGVVPVKSQVTSPASWAQGRRTQLTQLQGTQGRGVPSAHLQCHNYSPGASCIVGTRLAIFQSQGLAGADVQKQDQNAL